MTPATCHGYSRGTLTDRLRQIEAAILEYRPSPEVAERAARLDAMGRDGHAAVVSDFGGLMQSYADWANELRLVGGDE